MFEVWVIRGRRGSAPCQPYAVQVKRRGERFVADEHGTIWQLFHTAFLSQRAAWCAWQGKLDHQLSVEPFVDKFNGQLCAMCIKHSKVRVYAVLKGSYRDRVQLLPAIDRVHREPQARPVPSRTEVKSFDFFNSIAPLLENKVQEAVGRVLRRLYVQFKYSKRGCTTGVCEMLDGMTPADRTEAEAIKRVERYIFSVLRYGHLHEWIMQHHPRIVDKAMKRYGINWQKTYRMAWVSHMLHNQWEFFNGHEG